MWYRKWQQEIWDNAHETRESLWQFLFANCQSVSSLFVAVHSWILCCSRRSHKLIINSMSVPICNRFHATPDNCGKITIFRRSSRLWRPPAPGSMNLKDRDLGYWNLRLMLKISYAGCLGLTPAISSQFSTEMRAASKYCEKFTKNPFWEGSRLSLIHIWRCRRIERCRSRWSPYH